MLMELRRGNIKLHKLERLIQGNANSPIEQVNTNYVSDNHDQDIASQFADVFKRAHDTASWTHPNDNVVRNCLIASNLNSCISNPSFVIQCNDLKKVIGWLKPTKSPGPDGIQNILVKNLPNSSIIRQTDIFNAYIALSYWPDYFKSAKIIPIFKKDKDPTDAQNYRPISVTNSVGLIFEKLVK